MDNWSLSITIFLFLIAYASGNLLKALEVPEFSLLGKRATLRCVYDMNDVTLYSLKWYHNQTEFYRYVPTERNGPVNIGPTNIFMLHEVSRDNRQVTLSLARLTSSATGTYKCEVMAEHPSFRTESAQAYMKVIESEFEPPVITGAQSIYQPEETVSVGCQIRKRTAPDLQPKLYWLVDGKEIGPSLVEKYSESSHTPHEGISLTLSAQQVIDSGGSVHLECRATLGPLESRTVKTIRVQMRDYFFSLSPYNDCSKPLPGSYFTLLLLFTSVML